jgi:hypothetical protein
MKQRQVIILGIILLLAVSCRKQALSVEDKRTDTIFPITQTQIDTSFRDTVVIIVTEDTTYVDTTINKLVI